MAEKRSAAEVLESIPKAASGKAAPPRTVLFRGDLISEEDFDAPEISYVYTAKRACQWGLGGARRLVPEGGTITAIPKSDGIPPHHFQPNNGGPVLMPREGSPHYINMLREGAGQGAEVEQEITRAALHPETATAKIQGGNVMPLATPEVQQAIKNARLQGEASGREQRDQELQAAIGAEDPALTQLDTDTPMLDEAEAESDARARPRRRRSKKE